MTPGPFVAAAVAAPTSRLVERFGRRAVLVPGGLIWGGAVMWMVNSVGTTPDFVSEWLPGMVLLGIGAGMLLAERQRRRDRRRARRELRDGDRR